MTVYNFFKDISVGGWFSIVIVLGMIVEITPLKINPIGWLGKHLNAEAIKRVDKIEKKLDEHIAQSYRTKILMFQDSLLMQGYTSFTQEQYTEILEAISDYEQYCQENNINNSKCKMAISYVENCYKKCLSNRSFANLPMN